MCSPFCGAIWTGGVLSEALRLVGRWGAQLSRNVFSILPSCEKKLASDGRTVLQLSLEALNLFLNALDLDIEDAQAATKAVIQSQLARGKFREAVATSEQARLQSMVFCEKIDAELRATRRDVRRVDWRNHVPNLIKEAEVHLDAQLHSERAILAITEEQMGLLDDESAEFFQVAEVARLMRQCRLRHLALQERLIGCRQVFFSSRIGKRFVAPPTLGRTDPLSGVLEPLLRAGEEAARRALDLGTPALMGPQVPRTLSLPTLLAWHFQPRREFAVSAEALVDERDWRKSAARQRVSLRKCGARGDFPVDGRPSGGAFLGLGPRAIRRGVRRCPRTCCPAGVAGVCRRWRRGRSKRRTKSGTSWEYLPHPGFLETIFASG